MKKNMMKMMIMGVLLVMSVAVSGCVPIMTSVYREGDKVYPPKELNCKIDKVEWDQEKMEFIGRVITSNIDSEVSMKTIREEGCKLGGDVISKLVKTPRSQPGPDIFTAFISKYK